MAGLPDEFHEAMLSIYTRAKDECDSIATRFLQMVNEHGGLNAAKTLLHSKGFSEGLAALWKKKRLDISMESLILKPTWENLFTEEERSIAKKRLSELDYKVSEKLGHRVNKEESWEKLIKAVEFLDKIRWQDEYNYLSHWTEIVDKYTSLPTDEKMLVHWLSYIANRMTNADNIWKSKGAVDNNILLMKEYREVESEEEIDNLISKFSSCIVFGLTGTTNLEEISWTLKKLFHYSDKSLLKFFEDRILEWQEENQGMKLGMYLASALYNLRNSSPTIIPHSSRREQIRQFKRIWCTLRDFRKWKIFNKLPESFSSPQAGDIWRNEFTEDQIELPIDRHIMRVFSRLVFPLKDIYLSGNDPLSYLKTARKIYPYPERFDVFWNIGTDLCKEGKCQSCIFGEGRILSLCEESTENCEVVKTLFNWNHRCILEECPLRHVQEICVKREDAQTTDKQNLLESGRELQKNKLSGATGEEKISSLPREGYGSAPINGKKNSLSLIKKSVNSILIEFKQKMRMNNVAESSIDTHITRTGTYLRFCKRFDIDPSCIDSMEEFIKDRRQRGNKESSIGAYKQSLKVFFRYFRKNS